MTEKKEDKQVRLTDKAHLTLSDLKSELRCRSFHATITELGNEYHRLIRVHKELQKINRLYGSIIYKQLQNIPLNNEEIDLIKGWMVKKREIEN